MVYRAIGVMSGSSLDGLDIAFVEFHEQAGAWDYTILEAECIPYEEDWVSHLRNAVNLAAVDYQVLHASYGQYIGNRVNEFIDRHQLDYKVALIASHGHTTFHLPSKKMTAQLGDGAAIAAATKLPVVSDLRAIDMAFGGQGAPIVPIGEKLLLGDYEFFLNIGGIANISHNDPPNYVAFDVCPANRVLNLLANEIGKAYDDAGQIASSGKVNDALLKNLNGTDYYHMPYPKSLANDFGTDIIYPLVQKAGLDVKDAMRTYVEHIVEQIARSAKSFASGPAKMLVTGGGGHNLFMIKRLSEVLKQDDIEVVVPDVLLVNYKEALIMAFMGVLRWRQEYNVLSSVTGASRDSIGGALWTGEEA